MKIESRQIVSQADIKKIIQLNESVKGTTDYMKYHMEMSYKHDNTKKGGFTNWKFLGYGYPFEHDEKALEGRNVAKSRNRTRHCFHAEHECGKAEKNHTRVLFL